MSPKQSNKILHLRAFAALWICAFHIQHFIIIGYFEPLQTYNPLLILNYHGYTAVTFFFCLSGFLFGTIYKNKTVEFHVFYWKRFIRIYPLYALCILAYLALFQNINFRDAINALTLKSYADEMGHLWSIRRELQCYLLFPFIFLIYKKLGVRFLIASYIVLLITNILIGLTTETTLSTLYYSLLLRLNEFILGIIAGVVFIKYPKKLTTIIVIILFFISVMTLHYTGWEAPLVKNAYSIIWLCCESLFYIYLIYWYINSSFELPKIIYKPLNTFGNWSFSFYLIHYPVIMYFMNNRELLPENSILIYLYIILICLGLSALSYVFVEQYIIRLKNRLTV